MSPAQVLASLREGDIFKLTRTLKVVGADDGDLRAQDVQSGVIANVHPSGTLKVEVVKKAKPKVKVGDELTTNEVREHQWKRGTVLEWDGYTYVLTANGEWFSPGKLVSDDGSCLYTGDIFQSFNDLPSALGYKWTVVHLP